MTKGSQGRLASNFVAAMALTMVAVVPQPVAALSVAASHTSADSSAPAAPHADSGRAAPAPAQSSVTPPNDAVHLQGPPSMLRAGAPKGPRPKPLKIVVPKGSPRVTKVTLGVRNRVFPDFAEKSEAVPGKPFQIGDSRYSATVTDFEPDFVIEPESHSITSRSIEPRNPAVRIIVREAGVPQDTTWAFLNMPPHFVRKSLLAFEILRIDFADRPAIARDSTTLGRLKP